MAWRWLLIGLVPLALLACKGASEAPLVTPPQAPTVWPEQVVLRIEGAPEDPKSASILMDSIDRESALNDLAEEIPAAIQKANVGECDLAETVSGELVVRIKGKDANGIAKVLEGIFGAGYRFIGAVHMKKIDSYGAASESDLAPANTGGTG